MATTMDAAKVALIDALNLDLQRKANDLFVYAKESTPYVPRGDEHFLKTFERLVPIDQDNAESLVAAIRMLEGVPSPGCWDLGIADMNYLNVRFLARMILDQLHATAKQLAAHLELAYDYPKIKAILHSVLDDTRFEIEQLEEALNRKGAAAEKKA
jgi:uncharacterized protein (DUF305 family)